MTDYQPVINGSDIDLTTPDDHAKIDEMINLGQITHLQTTAGWVYLLRGKLNAKSVPIHDPSNGVAQRVTFDKVASFGVMPPAENPVDQAIKELNDMGATVSISRTPGTDPHPVTEVVQESINKVQDTAPAHAERAHALLSASSAHRWLHCTPSARISERYPDNTSEAAEEGTAAHELAEHKLRLLLGEQSQRPESVWFNEDMDTHTDDYADCVMAELEEARKTSPAAFVAVEQRLDFSHLVPDGFGTGDAIIVGDGRMTIVDLKYGKGVEVSAEGNPQMRLYALGALAQFGMIYSIDTVRMVIFQPRLSNVSVDEITAGELVQWGESVVKPAAKIAEAGEGELVAGEWCRFCSHRAQCPAQASLYMEPVKPMLDAVMAPTPDTLSDEQIARIVTLASDVKKWLTAVEKHALDAANNGKQYPGLKLVEGRSVRKYTDDQAVAEAVQEAGFDPWERKVLGVTAMTKLLGKPAFDQILGGLIHKPAGKPTLVPESDKRPALTVASPGTVFQPIESKETA